MNKNSLLKLLYLFSRTLSKRVLKKMIDLIEKNPALRKIVVSKISYFPKTTGCLKNFYNKLHRASIQCDNKLIIDWRNHPESAKIIYERLSQRITGK
jgi:hypothetical protein